MRQPLFIGAIASLTLTALVCGGCGYRFEGSEQDGNAVTISVPYVNGDIEGQLNSELVKALSSSGRFDCVQNGGQYILEVSIIADSDDSIGYRYDRNPTSGKLRKNIVGTENRRTISAEMRLVDSYTRDILVGPQIVKGYSEYDYVDSNSIRDLTFINTHGVPQTVLNFSLGQLDSIEGAHDDSSIVAYRNLAQKVIDAMIIHSSCLQKQQEEQ